MIKLFKKLRCRHEFTKVVPVPVSDGFSKDIKTVHICKICGKKIYNKYRKYSAIR